MHLPERFEVSYLLTGSNRYEAPSGLRSVRARALRDMLPRGPLGELSAGVIGDRYLARDAVFAEADIVHAEELSFWFAADAARRRAKGGGFRLVQTIWETLPMLRTYRNRHARAYRDQVLAHTDLFLPATERAAEGLRLEGVEESRMLVCPPGIETERFVQASAQPPAEHTIVSPGRLVWDKGHQDVLRALAVLHRGIVRLPDGVTARPRLLIVGSGPEAPRLREHADELGVGSFVEIRGVPYEEMPSVFASASAMVLASQASATAALHPFDVPRAFWEEQFGLVLAEAMAAGLPILASSSGAIPEVLAGTPATLFRAGDWMEIARALAVGPLTRPPASRIEYPAEIVRRYSTHAAAERLAEAYDRVLTS